MDLERYRWRLVASSIGVALLSVPLVLGVVPPNGIYGFRTSLTRSSPAIWYRANAFLGWALLLAAVVSVAGLVRLSTPRARRVMWAMWAMFVGPILGAVAASFVYLGRLG